MITWKYTGTVDGEVGRRRVLGALRQVRGDLAGVHLADLARRIANIAARRIADAGGVSPGPQAHAGRPLFATATPGMARERVSAAAAAAFVNPRRDELPSSLLLSPATARQASRMRWAWPAVNSVRHGSSE